MSELKSLEKLRAWVRCVHGVERVNSTKTCANLDANAIEHANALFSDLEAEIASDYMRLPVDADGVPIHIGDMVDGWCALKMHGCGKQPVHGMYCAATVAGGIGWRIDNEYGSEVVPKHLRHVKQRTLEEVLRDVWNEALDYAKSDIWRNPDEVFAERADEIRELLGLEINEPDTIRNELLGGDAE